MDGDSRNSRVSLLKKYDIPIDHLSFEYVSTCKDKKELERIARILSSGEEGNYPNLLEAVKNKLQLIAPESRVLRVETPAITKEYFSSNEWKELEKDLETWEDEMNRMGNALAVQKSEFDMIGDKYLPEVRKVTKPEPDKTVNNEVEIKKIKVETKKDSEKIKYGDYAAWDKFDVDKELLKLDLEDEKKEEKNAKTKREMEKQTKQAMESKVKPVDVDKGLYSDVERQILADQAKDRGNECYKSGEYEQALKYYKVSLNLCECPATYNNRAMTYIKMKKYEDALTDCNKVLSLQPKNVKALHRRATCYQNLPGDWKNNNELALKDILQIISLEPSNTVAQTDLQALKKKLKLPDTEKKMRMMVEDNDNGKMKEFLSESKSVQNELFSNDDEDLAAVRELPLTYYGPSTSTFQCEPQSMTHRMLSGSSFSGQVRCKCNSNATRQNPLCYHCGERLSRPKRKSKLTAKPSTQAQESKTEVNDLSKEVKENNEKSDSLESKKLESGEAVKPNEVNEKCQESGDSEVQTKPIVQEENEKPNVEVDDKKDNSSDNPCMDKEIKPSDNDASNEKAEKKKNNVVEVNSNVNGAENEICNKTGSEGIENTMDELKNEQKLVKPNILSGGTEDDLSKTGEINGNGLLYGEPDVGIRKSEDKDNEPRKDPMKQASGEEWIRCDKRDESKIADDSKNIATNTKEITSQSDINGNENKCLPTTSNGNESKSDSKRIRSKKKKSKESRQDGSGLLYSEPVKIVQATKYLKPTSAEPKPECDKSKENTISESNSQNEFKSFTPSMKCMNPEDGAQISATPSLPNKVTNKDSRTSQQTTHSVNNKDNCEEDRGNILENGNDQNWFKTSYTDESSASLKSSFEFMRSWESLKKSDESYEKRAEIIKVLRPTDLKTVIGNNLDSDMLKSLLECLEKHFLNNDPVKVAGFLKELPLIPRFGIINLFLNPNERKVLDRLIENTEKKGFMLDEDVKNMWKAPF